MQLRVLIWALVMVGFTTIVTQSKLLLPLRSRWVKWHQRRPVLMLFFNCPMCIGFWAGFGSSAIFKWGVSPPLPYHVAIQWIADGLASSAICWITYVVLYHLGAGKL